MKSTICQVFIYTHLERFSGSTVVVVKVDSRPL